MIIFKILKHLYTDKKADWIKDINESDIQPFLIQRWLCMNDKVRTQTRWLDKYVFCLNPKMYLSLAWSVLPKTDKTPYVKYITKVVEKEELEFLIPKIRKHLQLSDNDFNVIKTRLIKTIKEKPIEWFCFYGVPKKYWKQNNLDFNAIKEFGDTPKPKLKGLDAWGLI